MKHAVPALLLLAAAAQAQAGITDNFLDSDLESQFRLNFIYELARQDIPISNEMVGGAFQFGEALPTSATEVTIHGTNEKNETLYSVRFPGAQIAFYKNFPDCPSKVECYFYFYGKPGERPREGFQKGDTFLIENLKIERTDSGEFIHFFELSEAQRTFEGVRPKPGQENRTVIQCVAPTRLKKWALYVGFNNYIYPLMRKRDKETVARAPLPEVPRTGGGGEKSQKKAEGKPAGKGEATSQK